MDLNDTLVTAAPPVVSKTIPPRVRRIFKELRKQCEEKMELDSPLQTGSCSYHGYASLLCPGYYDLYKGTHCRPRSDDMPYCHREADNWGGCWPDTIAGNVSRIPCPDLPIFNTNNYAYRACTLNGSWLLVDQRASANYTMCPADRTMDEEDVTYIYIFIGGFIVSIITLLISLTIFYTFRQLRCDRITIHKNLFMSYVFTGVSWVLYYVLVALEGQVLMNNPLWCRALHVICQYCTVCNFFWMFCEGLYLNTIMVYAFSSGKVLIISCYVIGWGLPVILAAIYAGVRNNNELDALDCWFEESKLQWIVYGPVVLSIVINVLFLINIVRLLITKLREMPEVTQTNEEKMHQVLDVLPKLTNLVFTNGRHLSTWKATRATLILVPLLGLQYLLFPMRPSEGSPLDPFYHISVALIVSLQGAFVSTMYCFCNGEVLSVMSRKYTQRRLMRKRSSIKSNSGPAGTAYTTIDHVSAQNNSCVLYKDMTREKLQFECDEC